MELHSGEKSHVGGKKTTQPILTVGWLVSLPRILVCMQCASGRQFEDMFENAQWRKVTHWQEEDYQPILTALAGWLVFDDAM